MTDQDLAKRVAIAANGLRQEQVQCMRRTISHESSWFEAFGGLTNPTTTAGYYFDELRLRDQWQRYVDPEASGRRNRGIEGT